MGCVRGSASPAIQTVNAHTKRGVVVRRMFRYEVPVDDQWHEFQLTRDPVHVAVNINARAMEFWAEFVDGDQTYRRVYRVFGTGHEIPDDAHWVGTAERVIGLVFHLYEDWSRYEVTHDEVETVR